MYLSANCFGKTELKLIPIAYTFGYSWELLAVESDGTIAILNTTSGPSMLVLASLSYAVAARHTPPVRQSIGLRNKLKSRVSATELLNSLKKTKKP